MGWGGHGSAGGVFTAVDFLGDVAVGGAFDFGPGLGFDGPGAVGEGARQGQLVNDVGFGQVEVAHQEADEVEPPAECGAGGVLHEDEATWSPVDSIRMC